MDEALDTVWMKPTILRSMTSQKTEKRIYFGHDVELDPGHHGLDHKMGYRGMKT